jgi:transcriptional regulator with XRE-family HTH domain
LCYYVPGEKGKDIMETKFRFTLPDEDPGDEVGDLTAFQEFLAEVVASLQNTATRGNRRKPLSETQIARKLGVKQATFSAWMNGNRKPDYRSAIKLAQILGDGVFDALGYPKITAIHDPKLRFLVDCWEYLDSSTIDGIFQEVKEEIERGGPRKKKPPIDPFKDIDPRQPGPNP